MFSCLAERTIRSSDAILAKQEGSGLKCGKMAPKTQSTHPLFYHRIAYIYIYFCLFWLWSSLVFVAWKRAAQTFCWISSLVFFGAEKVIWVSKWCEASLLGKKKKRFVFFLLHLFCFHRCRTLMILWFVCCYCISSACYMISRLFAGIQCYELASRSIHKSL